MIEDVTQRKRAEEELRRQAERHRHESLHDPLTGLANRRLYQDRLERAILTAARAEAGVAIVMLDLDRFKEVNDSLGHGAGDALLTEIGTRLLRTLRDSDTAARLGGDEFGLVLWRQRDSPARDCSDVREALGRIQTELAQPVPLEGRSIVLGASLGVALFPEDGAEPETLTKCADIAMYAAKRGCSPYVFYTDELASRRSARKLTRPSATAAQRAAHESEPGAS
jgi:diguanylate cyclase (GGDEF)-like protein